MLKPLTDLLYIVSNALLGPSVLFLLLLLAWTLLLLGGLCKEALERRRVRSALAQAMAASQKGGDPLAQLRSARSGAPARLVRLFEQQPDVDSKTIRRSLAILEHDVTAILSKHTFITRVSPMIGLMATLIPLGPALSELAGGNLQALAGNLVVAFTATVIGLLISAMSYGMGLLRRSWYARDLLDLEAIYSTALEEIAEYVA